MPVVTREDEAFGVIGLTVVRARRNSLTPARLTRTPRHPTAMVRTTRPGKTRRKEGSAHATSHIRKAVAPPRIGGGIRSSRERMSRHSRPRQEASKIRGRHDVVSQAEPGPPNGHTGIRNHVAMNEIEQSMRGQGGHDDSQIALE